MGNDQYDEKDGMREDDFLQDDAYEEYDDGQDLSGDPMASEEKRKGWLGRRRERKERMRQEQKERERAALKAEILAEIKAERAAEREAAGLPAEGGEASDAAGSRGGYADPESDPMADQSEEPRRRSKFSAYLMTVLSGNILSKAEVRKVYPYLLLLVFLMFLYIGNVFRMQQLHRTHGRLTREVAELRAKSMTIASQKMRATRQSSIMQEIARRGIPLEESLAPNKVISED